MTGAELVVLTGADNAIKPAQEQAAEFLKKNWPILTVTAVCIIYLIYTQTRKPL